jgi:hypothetical protein
MIEQTMICVFGLLAIYLSQDTNERVRRWACLSGCAAQAQISTCSILRDWIKGQITAIEVGLLTFEGAFLGQILLPSGKTVLEHAESNKLLALKGEST